MIRFLRTIFPSLKQKEDAVLATDTYSKLRTGAAYRFVRSPAYADKPLPTVVLTAGWKSNSFSSTYDLLAERLRAAGYNTLQLSLRGHQGADGDIDKVSREDHAEDIMNVFFFLETLPEADPSRLGVVAASYGAYLMADVVPEFHLKALVLRAPALYPDEWWKSPTAELVARPDRLTWRSVVHTTADSETLRAVRRLEGHILFVASEHDEDIPPQVLESYVNAAGPSPRVTTEVLKGATHVLNDEQRQVFIDLAVDFLKRTL